MHSTTLPHHGQTRQLAKFGDEPRERLRGPRRKITQHDRRLHQMNPTNSAGVALHCVVITTLTLYVCTGSTLHK